MEGPGGQFADKEALGSLFVRLEGSLAPALGADSVARVTAMVSLSEALSLNAARLRATLDPPAPSDQHHVRAALALLALAALHCESDRRDQACQCMAQSCALLPAHRVQLLAGIRAAMDGPASLPIARTV